MNPALNDGPIQTESEMTICVKEGDNLKYFNITPKLAIDFHYLSQNRFSLAKEEVVN